MTPSMPMARGDYQRLALAAAAEDLVDVLRSLADVDQVEEEQLVTLLALSRLLAERTWQLYALAARHRSAAWLGRLELAVAARARAARAEIRDVSLAALARALDGREERVA